MNRFATEVEEAEMMKKASVYEFGDESYGLISRDSVLQLGDNGKR